MTSHNVISHRNKKTPLLTPVLLLIVVLLTGGCRILPFELDIPWFDQTQGRVTPTVLATDSGAPVGESSADITPTPPPQPDKLTIWLPPDLDPEGSTQAAVLLKNRLDEFAGARGISIEVRLKNSTGPSGLLDALTATSGAAPSALPDLLVLDRKDLETAALKSLIYPLDDITSIVDGEDWFPYAQSSSLIQGVVYGIPFASDPLGLVYDSVGLPAPAISWEGIATNQGNLAFAADDPQAVLPLTLYLAMGGSFQDDQRHPILEVEALTRTLELLQSANFYSHINQVSLQFQNFDQVWQAFQSGQANMAVVPISYYLSSVMDSNSMSRNPGLAVVTPTTTSSWIWASASSQPERRKLAIELAENLVETGFLSGWTEAQGKLPARPSALEAWKDGDQKKTLETISITAFPYPSSEIFASIAPVLRNATLLVLRDNANPLETAQQAVEGIK